MSAALDHRLSHFEHKLGAQVYPVLPGEHLVILEEGVAVSTLLGSCVSACIRDTRSGRGGLNHFLLPGTELSQSTRYGAFAMEVLINEILSAGGARDTLEAKVFGAGEMIANTGSLSVGRKNARFVRDYLNGEGVKIVAEDLGGTQARRVFFFPDSGIVRVQYLSSVDTRNAIAGEENFARKLTQKPRSGGVELF
jgi:chemotaxis protein CheD